MKKILTFITFFALPLVSHAVPLMTAASGNESAATTWVRVDTTSFLDSEVSGGAFLSTSYAFTSTFNFTSGGTVDGIAFKFRARAVSPVGTITAIVAYSTSSQTSPTVISSTTINVADILYCNSGDTGWVLFKFSTPFVVPTGIGFVAGLQSLGSQIAPYRDGTVNNWSRAIRTTTNQTPTTGDQLIMIGENTGPGTGNSFTVNWDSATAVVFGTTVTATLQQSITIGSRMTVNAANSASTNYKMSAAGIIRVVNGGSFNVGSVGSPFPTSSTFVLASSGVANVDSGIDAANDGNFNIFAATKTPWVYLVADSSITANKITVSGDISNWVVLDTVTIASSDRTTTHTEISSITAISGQTITLAHPLAFAHNGIAPYQAEVGNLTRNVLVTGLSSAIQAYIFMENTSSCNVQYAEIKNMGSTTANKRGIDIATIAGGSATINGCSLHDNGVLSSIAINQSGASGQNYTVSNNVCYNNSLNYSDVANLGGTVSGNLFENNTGSGQTFSSSKVNYINNNAIGSANWGIDWNITAPITAVISGNISHSNNSAGQTFVNMTDATISTPNSYFNAGAGLNFEFTKGHIIVNNANTMGNLTTNIDNLTLVLGTGIGGLVEFNNLVCNSSSTLTTTECVRYNTASSQFIFNNLISGNVFPHARTNAVNGTAVFTRAIFRNPIIAESTFVIGQTIMSTGSYIAVQKYNRVAGDHRDYKAEGLVQTDSVIFNTASPSIRMTPIAVSPQLLSSDYAGRSWEIAVSSAQTGTVSVFVRNSVVGDAGGAAYNGVAPQLWVHANPAIGILSDTAIATYSGTDGTWQQITGSIPVPTDDGIEEFYVTNNGTTGWTNFDDFGTNIVNDTTGIKYWIDGSSDVNQNNTNTKTNTLIQTTINSPSVFQ